MNEVLRGKRKRIHEFSNYSSILILLIYFITKTAQVSFSDTAQKVRYSLRLFSDPMDFSEGSENMKT